MTGSSNLPPEEMTAHSGPGAEITGEPTPEMIAAMLRTCATVVRPGEVLVVRVSEDWGPEQAGYYQDYLDHWAEENAPGLKFLVLAAAAIQPVGTEVLDAAADTAVERALRRQRFSGISRALR